MPFSHFSPNPGPRPDTRLPNSRPLRERRSPRDDASELVGPRPFSDTARDKEGTVRRWKACFRKTRRSSDNSRGEANHAHSHSNSRGISGTATRGARTTASAPDSPPDADALPRVRRRCARGPRRRATGARGRRPPPPAGASALRPAPPPPPARPGSSCTPFGVLGRASRYADSPSSNTCEVAPGHARRRPGTRRGAPEPFARVAPGAHCVVPQGQFSNVFGFAPHMVQVSRSASALARAFLASYSRCFFS